MFTKINKDFNFNVNFWTLNPQMQFIEPFNKLYKMDDGGEKSSKYMWSVFFMTDPDDEVNIMFRLPEFERRKSVENFFPEIDWENKVFKECLEQYPFKCLTAVQRALLEEFDSLIQRVKILRETPYTLDDYMREEESGDYIYDKSGKPIPIKGTAKQLDDMRAKSKKFYEDIEVTIKKFMDEKADESRVWGGRKQTISELGLL